MSVPPPSAETRSRPLGHRVAPRAGGVGALAAGLGVTLKVTLAVALAATAACGRSRAADAGGDSALARDLAIVQMETNRARDSAADALARAASTPLPEPVDSGLDSATAPPPLPADTPTAASEVASRASADVLDTAVHAAARPADPCDSPSRSSQLTCLRRKLAEYDAPLNRVYQRYIERLRSAPESRGGGAPAIRKLRESQRAWLTYRDKKCEQRLAGKEPTLWAPARAACLGEYATARTRLLTSMLAGKR